mgnify:CR=1 FL=1
MNLGTQIEHTKTTVKKLDTKWKVTVGVFYTGRNYNIYVKVCEKGFFSDDRDFDKTKQVDNKEDISVESEKVIEDLFEYIKQRKDAEDVSLDINIE